MRQVFPRASHTHRGVTDGPGETFGDRLPGARGRVDH